MTVEINRELLEDIAEAARGFHDAVMLSHHGTVSPEMVRSTRRNLFELVEEYAQELRDRRVYNER